MHGHQGHFVAAVFVVIGSIGVAQQRGGFKEVGQCDGMPDQIGIRNIHVRQDVIQPLFLESLHRIQQFVEVRSAGHTLDGSIRLEEGIEPGIIIYLPGHIESISRCGGDRQIVHQRAERTYLLHCGRAEEVHIILAGGGCEQRRQAAGAAEFVQPRNRGIPYSAGRLPYRTLEGLVVIHVYAELEPGHHILDFSTVEERITRINHIRYVLPAKSLLKGTGLGIRTVEYGEVGVLGLLAHHAGDYPAHYLHRLLLLGVGLDEFYLLPFLSFGVAFLGDTAFVMGYYRVRGVHYVPGRTVVLFKADYLGFGVILLEIQDILDLSTAEGVDGLAVIPHHAKVAVRSRKLLENQILGVIGILVLVHHYEVEAGCYLGTGLLIVAEKDVHVHQDIVEVHDSVGL